MKIKDRIKLLLKAETEFTNRHLSRKVQITIGIMFFFIMTGLTIYAVLYYESFH